MASTDSKPPRHFGFTRRCTRLRPWPTTSGDFTMVYHPSVRHSVLAAAKLSETLECCAPPFPLEIQPL